MVGIPRSKGCTLCIKRRIKCDEGKPTCENCGKYGAACPGYGRDLKFIGEKHHISRTRPRKETTKGVVVETAASIGVEPSTEIASQNARPTDSTSHGHALKSAIDVESDPSCQIVTFVIPKPDRAQYLNTMIHSLCSTSQGKDIRAFHTWLYVELPPSLENKITLDAAMATLALHFLGTLHKDDQLIGESCRVYGQSLSALQRALHHPTEWKSSETLATAMILAMFELFAGTHNCFAWMKHAAGVCTLVKRRGVGAYQDPLDKSMLASFGIIMTLYCLFSGQDCFLADPAWMMCSLRLDTLVSGVKVQEYDLDELIDTAKTQMARVPAIVHSMRRVREAVKRGHPVEKDQVARLMHQAKTLRSEALLWCSVFGQLVGLPENVPSTDPLSLFDTALVFSDPWHGSLYMGYWASLALMQECLTVCGSEVDYTGSNIQLAHNILRSIESVGGGIMGPYRIGYGLRIAYDFVDIATQKWILSMIDRLEYRYAAMTPAGYGATGLTRYAHLTVTGRT